VDEAGRPLPGQFESTATWTPKGDDVRWLLVDAVADIRGGKAARAFLEFGNRRSRFGWEGGIPGEGGPAAGSGGFELRDGEARVLPCGPEGRGSPRSRGRERSASGPKARDVTCRSTQFRGRFPDARPHLPGLRVHPRLSHGHLADKRHGETRRGFRSPRPANPPAPAFPWVWTDERRPPTRPENCSCARRTGTPSRAASRGEMGRLGPQ